jgi:hypothetical protein
MHKYIGLFCYLRLAKNLWKNDGQGHFFPIFRRNFVILVKKRPKIKIFF